VKVVSYSYGHFKSKNLGNLGDAIQTLAVMEFLRNKQIPVSGFVERRNLVDGMFINGWQKYEIERLPSKALFCSIHTDAEHLNDLDKNNLIGCRDHWTHSNCRAAGLESVVTGCVTINLPPPDREAQRTNETLFVDSIHKSKNQYTQKIDSHLSWEEQMTLAKNRLEALAKAPLVHTTRLHVLIPCIAMGTPVILDEIPGEKNRHVESTRFGHIKNFIQTKRPIEIEDGTRENLLEAWNANSEKVLDSYFSQI
jgi:hypothetical protein